MALPPWTEIRLCIWPHSGAKENHIYLAGAMGIHGTRKARRTLSFQLHKKIKKGVRIMKKTYEQMVDEQLDLQIERGGKFNFHDAAMEIVEREGLGKDSVYDLCFELLRQTMARGSMPQSVPSKRR